MTRVLIPLVSHALKRYVLLVCHEIKKARRLEAVNAQNKIIRVLRYVSDLSLVLRYISLLSVHCAAFS